ncbi:hypothetical protein M407DRAFT_113976 [Tulasnella calospora MUT 4182]|uniref:Secreted protein n=1 Tax=Tulasnella calospora MUT 4182 TaxID=1051891 RepID=A0A0C3KNP2_9AGAM|nr:hypothetical protein M407DRAFT_113976 [Tulasnella calospora MUT 4182]
MPLGIIRRCCTIWAMSCVEVTLASGDRFAPFAPQVYRYHVLSTRRLLPSMILDRTRYYYQRAEIS